MFSRICTDSRESLETIRALKQSFEEAFDLALSFPTTENIRKAQMLKTELETKMKEFQKVVDLSCVETFKQFQTDVLYHIEEKMNAGAVLTRQELLFLYEIHTYIDDLRIVSLLNQRNPEEDLYQIFDVDENQIARSVDQITPETKVYIGKLVSGIFQLLPEGIEYVYTSFPGDRIYFEKNQTGGKTLAELEQALVDDGSHIQHLPKRMMRDTPLFSQSLYEDDHYTLLRDAQEMTFVRMTVSQMGLSDFTSLSDIYYRAQELGLELCLPEDGIRYRMKDRPCFNTLYIGMQPIPVFSNTDPSSCVNYLFSIDKEVNGDLIRSRIGEINEPFSSSAEFLFRLPKKIYV